MEFKILKQKDVYDIYNTVKSDIEEIYLAEILEGSEFIVHIGSLIKYYVYLTKNNTKDEDILQLQICENYIWVKFFDNTTREFKLQKCPEFQEDLKKELIRMAIKYRD